MKFKKNFLLGIFLGLFCFNSNVYAETPARQTNLKQAVNNIPFDVANLKNVIETVTKTYESKQFLALNDTYQKKLDIKKDIFKLRVKTLDSKYLLAPGDIIDILVYEDPQFSKTDVLIRPDGYATIVPFGEIYAAGLSIEELTEHLKAKFKKYILEPQISINIDTIKIPKVYVYGAVQKAGLYQQENTISKTKAEGQRITLSPDLTIASVIKDAGGIKYNADLKNVQVINESTGKNISINLFKFLKEGDTKQDIYLSTGDSLYIPYLKGDVPISDDYFRLIASSSLAPKYFPVRVTGSVKRPGLHELKSESPRLSSAIAASAGYTIDANKKIVTIYRKMPTGNISKMFVNPAKTDLVLRPDDLIEVKDKKISVADRGFWLLALVMSPFTRFANTMQKSKNLEEIHHE